MLNDDIIKLKSTADIIGGEVFFATENGADPENLDYNNLVPNGMYIRLNGSDGSLAYISTYELDKILDTVKDVPNKVDKTDFELLQSLVKEKASDLDLELAQNEIYTKASKSELVDAINSINEKSEEITNELTEKIDLKADKSDVEKLNSTVEKKAEISTVNSLISTVDNKADSKDVNSLISDLNTLKETVKIITDSDSINIINTQIEKINAELKKKLEYSDIKNTIDNVDELNSSNSTVSKRLDTIETKLNTKAATNFVQNEFNDVNIKLDSIKKTISEKANKTDVALKVNKSDYNNLVKKVNVMNTTLVDVDLTVKDKIKTLTNDVKEKANSDYVEFKINDLTTSINSKVSTIDFIDNIDNINKNIDTLESNYSKEIKKNSGDIETLECKVDNHITEFHSHLIGQNKKNDSQDKKLTEIQETTNKHTEQLKQTWVRTLSSNEYNRLLKAPNNTSYNPRYKYPNTIYLVVDFNIPKAVYIGDILIAKAQPNGSLGFAYNFPISF